MAFISFLEGGSPGSPIALHDGDLIGTGQDCQVSLAREENARYLARVRLDGDEHWLEVLEPGAIRLDGQQQDILELYDGARVTTTHPRAVLLFSEERPTLLDAPVLAGPPGRTGTVLGPPELPPLLPHPRTPGGLEKLEPGAGPPLSGDLRGHTRAQPEPTSSASPMPRPTFATDRPAPASSPSDAPTPPVRREDAGSPAGAPPSAESLWSELQKLPGGRAAARAADRGASSRPTVLVEIPPTQAIPRASVSPPPLQEQRPAKPEPRLESSLAAVPSAIPETVFAPRARRRSSLEPAEITLLGLEDPGRDLRPPSRAHRPGDASDAERLLPSDAAASGYTGEEQYTPINRESWSAQDMHLLPLRSGPPLREPVTAQPHRESPAGQPPQEFPTERVSPARGPRGAASRAEPQKTDAAGDALADTAILRRTSLAPPPPPEVPGHATSGPLVPGPPGGSRSTPPATREPPPDSPRLEALSAARFRGSPPMPGRAGAGAAKAGAGTSAPGARQQARVMLSRTTLLALGIVALMGVILLGWRWGGRLLQGLLSGSG